MSNTQNKLHLYQPKSKLALINTLSQELLSDFTDFDIVKYHDEFTTLKDKKSEDVSKAQIVISTVREGLTFLFGDDSRQVKYIDRAMIKGETIIDSHYAQYSTPSDVRAMIESAKIKCGGSASNVGLSETNVDEVNDAIAYLIRNGYTFGRDFTAHNAVDMAKIGYVENCIDDESNIKLADDIEDCPECNTTYDRANVKMSNLTLSCRCYDDTALAVYFSKGAPFLGESKKQNV